MAVHQYQIDLQEAEVEEALTYPSFNAFFTRRLKSEARPIKSGADALISPADGVISQIGSINKGQIFQAKNRLFSTRALLGCSQNYARDFSQGSFATIYLSPRDYHRVHMPVDGNLIQTNYIPGKLFSVNNTTTRHIDRLFARNERLVCLFETDFGKMAVVLVGALFVAGIETRWNQHYQPGKLQTEHFSSPKPFKAGNELGLFKFGSTVVVVTEKSVNWCKDYDATTPCKMGQLLGEFQGRK